MSVAAQLKTLLDKGQRALNLDLQGVGLAGAELSCLHADGLNARTADLRNARLLKTRFCTCSFDAAKLENTDWSKSTLHMCVFDNADCTGARFDGARLEDSSARGADLRGASLRNTRLSETRFERAILRDAVFDGAGGDGVVFRGADLGGASLAGVQFEDADFRGADLRGANLSGGAFLHADFRGALLEGVSFADTDCTGAYFDQSEEPPRAAAPGEARETQFQEFEALLQDFVRHVEIGAIPRSSLLEELLRQAGVGSQRPQAPAPEQAAMLRQVLDSVRRLEVHAERPEDLLKHCQALLEGVLPQLGDTLSEADWQALSNLLSRLQTTAAASPPQAD